MYESNCAIRYAYFPTNAIISVQYVLECGDPTAIMVIGNEGVLGLSVIDVGARRPSQSLVQSAGYAYLLPSGLVRQEFSRHEEFLVLMLRYAQALITQAAQTAACNRHHSIDQQICRWLLMSLDRLSDNRVTMTHECIGNMLGVRREGVTQAATKLRDMGVISYKRGLITVLNRAMLESLSCECYEVVKKETERLLPHKPKRQTIEVVACAPVVTMALSRDAEARRAERNASHHHANH